MRLSTVTGGIYTKRYTYRDINSSRTTSQVASVVYDLPTDQTFAYTYDNMGNIATYTDLAETEEWIAQHDSEIQCIVTESLTHPRKAPFGEAQRPTLADWPDGVDVMHFLQTI